MSPAPALVRTRFASGEAPPLWPGADAIAGWPGRYTGRYLCSGGATVHRPLWWPAPSRKLHAWASRHHAPC